MTGTLAKSRSKGKSVSVERKQGDCYHLKAKGKCTKGDACSVRHNESKRERITSFSSPTPKWQTNNDVNNSSKGTPPRGSSPSGKGARITLVEVARTPRVLLGILPSVRIANLNRAASSVKGVRFCTKRLVDRQPNKRPKKGGGKGSAALLKNAKQLGCVSLDIEPPKFKSILRKGPKFLCPKRCVQYTKMRWIFSVFRERKGPSLVLMCAVRMAKI